MKKIVAITQARIGSSRLPAKVLKTIGDQTLLDLHLQRVAKSRLIDQLVVATTREPGSEAIIEIAGRNGAGFFLGSLNDVLDRFYQTALTYKPDYVVRLTSDCPLLDPELLDSIIAFALAQQADYVSNTLLPTFPDGQDIEVFRFSALEKAWKEAILPSEREHVTPYIWKNSSYHQGTFFTSTNFSSQTDYSQVRLTVDEPLDLLTIAALVQQLGTAAGWEAYANYYVTHPEIVNNDSLRRNEGYSKSLREESKQQV